MRTTKEGQLKVWWVRNPPANAEYTEVKDATEAQTVLTKLANEDLKDSFVHDNAGGLEVYENGEWTEFYDDEGRDIDEIMDEEELIAK